ncbi:MAG: hypothetical protein SOV16_08495 [Anaerobiospirillum succiniciproducens]|uniref:hypothetical protein n=1 Tax=Anaerobiospirillum succiniciproducens TaxID=13335 RepID=UPI0023533745|nr:hypothetical protein [Anaerobiospirillum succiniciproducens]MCI6864077.1 hypothetical protein [Anaerobiospirillum succiniciproducens]MDY2799177.1 hypothetical protein [Anaerobiospirillum succiniciproducens]
MQRWIAILEELQCSMIWQVPMGLVLLVLSLDALWGGMGLLFGEDKMELPLKSGSFKEI